MIDKYCNILIKSFIEEERLPDEIFIRCYNCSDKDLRKQINKLKKGTIHYKDIHLTTVGRMHTIGRTYFQQHHTGTIIYFYIELICQDCGVLQTVMAKFNEDINP